MQGPGRDRAPFDDGGDWAVAILPNRCHHSRQDHMRATPNTMNCCANSLAQAFLTITLSPRLLPAARPFPMRHSWRSRRHRRGLVCLRQLRAGGVRGRGGGLEGAGALGEPRPRLLYDVPPCSGQRTCARSAARPPLSHSHLWWDVISHLPFCMKGSWGRRGEREGGGLRQEGRAGEGGGLRPEGRAGEGGGARQEERVGEGHRGAAEGI